MTDVEHTSDSEIDDPNKITDAAACLDYLKRREVFLYKMMNDPSHKAMLYFLEVLMNSEAPVTIDQLAARFTHKSFSQEMRDACGGGSAEGLRDFLKRYPSLFNVRANGQVTSVAIELPGLDNLSDSLADMDGMFCATKHSSSVSEASMNSVNQPVEYDGSPLTPTSKSNKLVPSEQQQQSQQQQQQQTQRKTHPNSSANENSNENKLHSSSSLSLASSPSIASSNSSSGSASSAIGRNTTATFKKDKTFGTEKYHIPHSTSFNRTNLNRRVSNPSLSGWTKSAPIGQPATQVRPSATTPTMCDVYPSTVQLCSSLESQTVPAISSCVHCHLLDLACHHSLFCPATHSHVATHCFCTPARIPATTICPHCYPAAGGSAVGSKTTITSSSSYCALPPMEKLVLETEAVRFFQQRLMKRDERWVPIKSLAGHLSQATPAVRAIVGPQLEFRNFLLKHPHVFEVQGELVSVKDAFFNLTSPRRGKERSSSAAVHGSLSSTNLSTAGLGYSGQSFSSRNNLKERTPRPKSLILPNSHPFASFLSSSNSHSSNLARKNVEFRRSTHFAENCVTACYPASRGPSHSGSTSSAPTTPTGSNPSLVPGAKAKSLIKSDVPLEGAVSSSMELETGTTLSSCSSEVATTNSLSISMSANEYRAIMFLRKVLEKKGGGPGQPGVPLSEMMQILSTKAPESVQSTIGWTKIELEEFIAHHSIFFEVKSNTLGNGNTGSSAGAMTNGSANTGAVRNFPSGMKVVNHAENSELAVANKRLERMINIVITGTKPAEGTIRTLTNRCGRIFHVAKLWGIIDLGKHEHVFFDKSIFKHVDDLQKHFKVDEILYFNAILAPKESRAKWRATQVWKECDRENVEKLGSLSLSCRTPVPGVPQSALEPRRTNGQMEDARCQTQEKNGPGMQGDCEPHSTDNLNTNGNEDTEAEEEIEDIEVEAGGSVIKAVQTVPINDSDCEFALAGDEDLEDDEPFAAAVAREAGLNLVNDVKFVSDDLDSTNTFNSELCRHNNRPNKEVRRNATVSLSSLDDGDRCNNHVSSSTHCGSVNSRTLMKVSNSATNLNDDATTSSSSASTGRSIAVQTLSTGDIMATQLYHDQSKQACNSG
ncbi:unnamed protein product [Calicophoron daubneyi]|uniref:Egal-1 winged helix domain-containing protein n=1 Tax=Calicophoron daubneyi TaxID=300641 RepID=A0AAV2T1X6_CALDB